MNVMERIAYLSKVAKTDKKHRFSKLYKIVQNEDMLSYAWDCIRGNKGIKTAGVDRMNRSGFEERRDEHILSLSTQLRTGEYVPAPVRRVEIPKSNGKGNRPLGIPAIKDRLVQQAVKLILEAIYEPLFSDAFHGFRPRRSCQTAINDIVPRKFDWVIEGDIKGCFDNIKHSKLLKVLRTRIADERFIQLINKFLKSGYQMGFGTDGSTPVFATKDGTPQGGIVSPILANIYISMNSISLWPHSSRTWTGRSVGTPRSMRTSRTSCGSYLKRCRRIEQPTRSNRRITRYTPTVRRDSGFVPRAEVNRYLCAISAITPYRTPLEVANKIRNAFEQHGWHSTDDDKAEKGTIGRLVQGNSL